jgi:hypothetical protein
MDDQTKQIDINETLKKQFSKLPPIIQQAITGAHVEKHLRMLSNKHKLHLDQWQVLENEVTMTLMGMQPAEELEENIEKEVGVEKELARELANDIALEVFDPIRKEMERQLEHPDAQPKEAEPIEDMRSEILAKAGAGASFVEPDEDILETDEKYNAKSIQNESITQTDSTSQSKPDSIEKPNLTPDPKPKIKRSPTSGEYVPGIISTERKDIKDDPYRESPDE